MNKTIKYIPLLGLALVGFSSCDKFLDQQPDDNRIELKTVEDAQKLLLTAYPTRSTAKVAEGSSDNVLEVIENASRSTRFQDQVYNWEDITEGDNESPDNIWSLSWDAINTANIALETLQSLPDSPKKSAVRAEALLCRALNHFVLLNLFAQAYAPETAEQEPGIPYLVESQKILRPSGDRLSVASSYARIIADIEAGLPAIQDNIYGNYGKYHFTQKAAHAFAARVYLYHRDWEKVVEHTTLALGADPAAVLRDYDAFAQLPSSAAQGYDLRTQLYASGTVKNNLLLASGASSLGGFGDNLRYSHNTYVASHETVSKQSAWGENYVRGGGNLKLNPYVLIEPYISVFFPKFPDQQNWVNRALGSYYQSSTWAEFTTDEALLARAEAYIHLKQYPQALADMNVWVRNFLKTPQTLTEASITQWNESVPYSTASDLTARKTLHTSIPVAKGQQENYLQVLLDMRRIETLQTGLRWYDIKRYGIEVTRATLRNASTLTVSSNVLTPTDPRRALQIPAAAISAGMQPNRQTRK